MNLFLKQFNILLWKCWLLKKRHYVSTIFEFFLPLLTSITMVIAVSSFQPPKSTKSDSGYNNGPKIFNETQFDLNRNLRMLNLFDLDMFYLTAPANNCTNRFMEKFDKEISSRLSQSKPKNLHYFSFKTLEELDIKFSTIKDNTSIVVGILFKNTCPDDNDYNSFLKHFSFTLKTIAPQTLTPTALFPDKRDASPSKENFYTKGNQIGFIETQNLVNLVYLDEIKEIQNTNKHFEILNLKAYKYPYPAYVARPPATLIDFLPSVLIYGFIILFPIIVKRQSQESYNRVREMFKLMGLNDWAYFGSTFVHYLIEVALQSLLLTFLYTFKFGTTAVFNYTNPFLVFIILLMYCVNLILLAFLVSIPFKKPIIAVIVSLVLFVGTDYLKYFLDPKFNRSIYSNSINSIQLFSCLLPNSSINFMMRVLSILELYSSGGNFSNLFETTFQYGSLSVGLILIMNFVSIIIYSILIWYLDAVYPFQYGIIKPWYFPLNPILKLFKNYQNTNEQTDQTAIESKYFEKEQTKNRIKISIKNLYKKFGKKTVVSNMNLNLHENHLIALLGPNSAGKTSLMNIITGLFPATSGKVIIDNYDIQKNPKKARSSLSLCPQHNILYDELTAYEHLLIYGTIKGKSSRAELEKEINELLQKLNLKQKEDTVSGGYSGGMKRKLNLAIALVGKSKIVILDEPSSGLDAQSRREVWDVLLKEKRSRTILLTTHYIEEADVLGDRILIMSSGKSKCYGTPMFLKRIFGLGYQLRIAKDLKFNSNNEARVRLNDFIRQHFKNTTISNENVGEIVYSLNTESNEDDLFPNFFKNFEQIKDYLNISTFGVQVTTLEDVFLKILNLSNGSETGSQSSKNQISLSTSGYDSSSNLAGISINTSIYSESVAPFLEDTNQNDKIKNDFLLLRQRMNGLLIKRLCHSKRYYPMIIFQVIIPVLIFWLILYLDSYLRPSWRDETALVLNNQLYGLTNGFFKDDINDDDLFESYNVTGYNSSLNVHRLDWEQDPNDYLLNISSKVTISAYIKDQLFGAVVKRSPINDDKNKLILELEIWYNNEASHSLPLSVAAIYNSLLEYINDNQSRDYQRVKLTNEPFPNQFSFVTKFIIISSLKIMWSLLTSLSLPFLAASYSLFPIHEYITKSKLLQKMSGANGFLYWTSTFIYDIITHILVCGLILILFIWQDKNTIFTAFPESMSGLFVLLFLFGLVSMNISYIFSRSFSSTGTGFLVIVVFYLITGVILAVIDFLLVFLVSTQFITQTAYNVMQWFFRIISPIYSMSKGVGNLYMAGSKGHMCDHLSPTYLKNNCPRMEIIKGCCKDICEKNCFDYKNPFEWSSDGILMEIFSLVLVFFITYFINIAIEESLIQKLYKLMPRISNYGADRVLLITSNRSERYLENSNEDSDVIQEKRRVEALVEQANKNNLPQTMLVHHITKIFNKFVAVDDLSFALDERECFGLLGVNGAGKTTTFRMLVGDLEPTDGTAYIKNINLINNLKQFQQQIGYCPQFDALLDNLTGEEMLFLFGRLRGIKEKHLQRTVDCIIKMVDLVEHSKFICSTYSGGNKRKLSLGMALIGLPRIIFLDEPSSGVDAEARRKIWKTLTSIKEKFNCSIVLTSHSMDECEALCSRIAIMINGKFKCINSVQNLRQKYGKGFILTIKLKLESLEQLDYLDRLKDSVRLAFPSSILKDFHETLLTYQILDNQLKWSFLFSKMLEIKNEFNLDYFFIEDTSLEQIFINFARQRYNE